MGRPKVTSYGTRLRSRSVVMCDLKIAQRKIHLGGDNLWDERHEKIRLDAGLSTKLREFGG